MSAAGRVMGADCPDSAAARGARSGQPHDRAPPTSSNRGRAGCLRVRSSQPLPRAIDATLPRCAPTTREAPEPNKARSRGSLSPPFAARLLALALRLDVLHELPFGMRPPPSDPRRVRQARRGYLVRVVHHLLTSDPSGRRPPSPADPRSRRSRPRRGADPSAGDPAARRHDRAPRSGRSRHRAGGRSGARRWACAGGYHDADDVLPCTKNGPATSLLVRARGRAERSATDHE